MRTATLLCLGCLLVCLVSAFMGVVSAWRGQWGAFWPWLGLAGSTLAHVLNLLSMRLMEARRVALRRQAEAQLRAIFEEAHAQHLEFGPAPQGAEWRS